MKSRRKKIYLMKAKFLLIIMIVISASGLLGCKKKVMLGCSNPGTHQDVGKNPHIKNTTRDEIPKGQEIFWKSSDGDENHFVLEQPLPPDSETSTVGNPGQVYTCEAWMYK